MLAKIRHLSIIAFVLFVVNSTGAHFHPPTSHEHSLSHDHDGFGSHTHRLRHADHPLWQNHGNDLLLNAMSHDLIAHSHTHPITHSHGGIGSHTHDAEHSHVPGGGEHPFVWNDINHTKDELRSIQTGVPVGAESAPRPSRPSTLPPASSSDQEAPSDEPPSTPPESSVNDRRRDDNTTPQQQIIQLAPPLATEWILLDHGTSVPQWIEFYNPNATEIDLNGWQFHYAARRHWKIEIDTITLTDFTIPAQEAVIFATHATRISTVDPEKVYILNTGYALKTGWKLTDADENVVHAIGELFTGLERTRPAPGTFEGKKWKDLRRISHKNYRSGEPEEPDYYGRSGDISHPGYHTPVRAAPSTPKRITLWGRLKQ